ncbi:MAG: outer membrane protein assembly factor BamD [Deferribacteraceae bacterium]|jgi:outer membrane protein assembly factor BamD|nr:outer membrane protein assembly factor BamD [Deferribacteraceae bacterium]
MVKYIIPLLILLSACSTSINVDMPSRDLIDEGLVLYNDSDYELAAEAFESAILNSDTPQEAQYAQQMLGEAYYADENYVEAIAAFEAYYDYYYEDSKNIPLILYKLGLSYASLSLHPKRDQTFAARAVDCFDQLESMYPETFNELGANEERKKMLEKLAEGEYQVGRYYIRQGQYDSALARFNFLLENYPDSPRYKDTLESIKEIDDARH